MLLLLSFGFTFALAKTLSILLYQITWNNGVSGQFKPLGSLYTLLLKPLPWLVHTPILLILSQSSWDPFSKLHILTLALSTSLILGTIGRLGTIDLKNLFLVDRALIVLFGIGVFFQPIFLYPLIITCGTLQYSVSHSHFHPGYSNLLGYEFVRSSLTIALSGLVSQALLYSYIQISNTFIIAVILCVQATYYLQQALSKCFLGTSWYSWLVENRLECLAINSWLRGWGANILNSNQILSFANFLSKIRILLCSSVWLLEVAWVFIFYKPSWAIYIIPITAIFHVFMFLLTGLLCYHFLINHALLTWFFLGSFNEMESLSKFLGIASICILLNLTWTLLFRRHLYHLYTNHKDKGIWKYLLDPSEHLMGWWDSPYMRMYSYQVTTSSGERLSFPVTKFSPYDTFITDIHTHMMILGRDWDIDSTLNSDRTQTRNGVWGLVVDPSYRDPMYKIMDDAKQGNFELVRLGPFKSKFISDTPQQAHESMNLESKTKLAFRNFLEAWNAYQKNKIFNFLSKWPHFPGEDLVPDISPLVPIKLPKYTQGQISQLHISCIKTFYTHNQIHLIENSHVATIDIPIP